jgi:DivIVA domain-containing protein
MTWLFALLVVVVMGVTAVVATGRGGSMSEVDDDRPRPQLPPPGPVTADALRTVRFTTAFRGYRMAEVDALLDRLAHHLDGAPGDDPDDDRTAPG